MDQRNSSDGRTRLLLVGGSSHLAGGVEAFCARATTALGARGRYDIVRVPTDTAYLSIRQITRLFRGLTAMTRHRREVACVWLQYGNLPDLTYLVVAKLLGMRAMVTPHLGSNWRSQTNPVLRSIGGRALALADRLALISWTQEDEISMRRDIPRSLIRNFLPEEVLNSELPPVGEDKVLHLIHSGRLSEGKGSFLVVEVCAALRDAGVAFTATITGGADDATYARLNAQIAESGLGEQVAMLGRVSDGELLDRLRSADILLHLSKIDSYPLISLEAIACGTLPVMMELAGARDQVETYGGHVVSAEHPVAEAAAWLAAQDVAELRRLGRESAARVRADYAWARCAGALEHALDACVAGEAKLLTQPDLVG